MLGWSFRKARHPASLHLIEDPIDFLRMRVKERRTGGRTHRRGDVVVAKADPLLRQAIQRGHVVAGGNWQVEPRLIAYDQNDVQRAVRWPRRGRAMGAGDVARGPVGGL